MNKAAVVEVDRSDHSVLVICNIAFCVNEAGCVFIDLNARSHKTVVKASRHTENEFFIGNMRNDNSHIHAAQGGVFNIITLIVIIKRRCFSKV